MSSPSERVLSGLEELRAGRMVILVDDEDRENEGDLVMAAEKVTPEAINFMAKYGRGLICLTLTEERVRYLDLPMMVDDNKSSRTTAFTVSIEARDGVTTGISAADRAHTIRVAIDENAQPDDIVSPGHIFPLRARHGGVLQRTGHTEGSIDLARLAGLSPSGVICEIMNDDGTMARMPDLVDFAEQHGLKILTIADLVQHRLETEQMIERKLDGDLELPSGRRWRTHVFTVRDDGRNFLAMTYGEINHEPTLVRVHTQSVLSDVFGVRERGRVVMDDVVKRIEAEGRGVIVLVPEVESVHTDLARRLGVSIPHTKLDSGSVLREYGLGAQILRALGLKKLRVLTNHPRRIAALDGYGLEVIEQLPTSESEVLQSGEMVAMPFGDLHH